MHILFKIQIALSVIAITCQNTKTSVTDTDVHQLWMDCKLEKVMSYELFNSTVQGQKMIENLKKKDIVTIIDYSKPSNEKRFFVIDLKKKQLLYMCLVAHGKNSGDVIAKSFSNRQNSYKSSLGFFLASETYYGDHGYSLRLDGLEKGINDNARGRDLVIHGASYVSEEFIRKYGRLGLSWGCPALPPDISKEIIDKISDGSCVYINGDDTYYKENSVFLNRK
jgi:hypothetical protein